MRRRVFARNLLLVFAVLLSVVSDAVFVHCSPSVPFQVVRVIWGESVDAPTEAYPGDEMVSLTVEAQNLSTDNETVKGVTGELDLNGRPFTDTYGNSKVTSTGTPTVSEVLSPTDEIRSKGFFTFTFTLNIDPDAVPGTYVCVVNIEYYVEVSHIFVPGEPISLMVELFVSRTESTLTVSVSPTTLNIGEGCRVSGSLTPSKENVTVTLTYRRPDNFRFNRTLRTDANGGFAESIRPDRVGFWNLNASWTGDGQNEGDSYVASFEVRSVTTLGIEIPSNRLVGGVDNLLDIRVRNEGDLPLYALELSFSISQPIVVQGNNRWHLGSLGAHEATVIQLNVYAPSSTVGNAYSGTLSADFRDDYGTAQTDTFPVGLVVGGKKLPAALQVELSSNRLTAGSDSELSIAIRNLGGQALNSLDVTLTVPSPLVIAGRNQWSLDNLSSTTSTSLKTRLYAPVGSIGLTYSGSLSVTYRDEYGETRTASFPAGFVVAGRIEIIIYEKEVTPPNPQSGSRFEISSTILNKGNVPAMYVNASIQPSDILTLGRESVSYVGEVGENSPSPFTLAAYLRPNVENGTYTVTLNISYRDDQNMDHSVLTTANLSVENVEESETGNQQDANVYGLFSQSWFDLTVVGAASAVILILYWKSRRSRKKNAT